MNKILILPIILIFLLGCVSFDEYTQEAKAKDYDEKLTSTTISGECFCFVCKKGSSSVPWPFDSLFDVHYKGGSCSFMAGCTEDSIATVAEDGTVTTVLQDQGYTAMPFMLGMGPRPWDFTYANLFCKNSLDFMVHWIHSDGIEYVLPPASEAECFLEKQVLPVYIFYSGSEAIDADTAGEFAKSVSTSGPVILVAEIDFNSLNTQTVLDVQEQIKRMRENCPRPPGYTFGVKTTEPYCLIAVAPKMGDVEGLKKVMEDPQVKSDVDLIAVGVNSHNLKSSDCKAATLFYEAISYSEFAWINYSKPVIWPYMLFDVSGTNEDGSCHWSEYEVNEAYYEFYAVLPAAISAGVIGAAPYQFYSAGTPTDPLNCAGCGMITIDVATNKLTAKEPLFSSWFYNCQKYTPENNYIITSFPKESGGTCNVGFTGGLFLDQAVTTESSAEFFIASATPDQEVFSCLTCIAECDKQNCETNPYKIPSAPGASQKCSKFEEIDLWASIRGLDPKFARAIAWAESGLDTVNPEKSYCAVSFGVPMEQSNCNSLQVLQFVDPQGNCNTELKLAFDALPADKKPCSLGLMQINTNNGGYPYIYWSSSLSETGNDLGQASPGSVLPGQFAEDILPAYDLTASDEQKKYRKAAESCAYEKKFNPFNGSHNACLGTWILKDAWDKAETWVKNNADKLDIASSEKDYKAKQKYLTAFIASYMYTGHDKKELWLQKYTERKKISGSGSGACYSGSTPKNNICCGDGIENNFIRFVSCCVDYDESKANSFSYMQTYCANADDIDRKNLASAEAPYAMEGLRRLAMYTGLISSCEQTCGKEDAALNANINTFIQSLKKTNQ